MIKSDITKQRILAAAEKEFSDMGFWGARIDRIAESAAINKRMLYEYFDSKENLYKIILRGTYEKYVGAELELLGQAGGCADKIRAYISLAFNYLSDNPHFTRMLMWENLNNGRYISGSDIVEVKNKSIGLLRGILNDGVAEGTFREDLDVDDVILTLNMLPFSYFSNMNTFRNFTKIEYASKEVLARRIAHTTDMIISYISAPEAKQ